MEIKYEDIVIKKLKREDIPLMQLWGSHKNTLLEDYNFPRMTDVEMRVWYRMKQVPFINKYFGIWLEGRLIGYLGIKNIKRIRRTSVLGLVFDPNYTSLGYGKKALEGFLNHYFGPMRMKTMVLEVTEFNERAYRLYKSMGFEEVGYYLDEFYNNIDILDPNFIKYQSSFVMKDEKIYNYIHKMKLDKGKYLRIGVE